MSAINVNSITGRTGLHGPVLTGVSTAADGFQVLAGEFKVNGISTFVGMSTFNGGIDVAGGDVTIDGTVSSAWTFDKSTNALVFKDNIIAKFGTGEDLKIYHDGSNSFIDDEGTGGLFIRAANQIGFRDAANSFANFANFVSGGTVDLYYNGNKKFETTNTGIGITGEVVCDSIEVRDDGSSGPLVNVRADDGSPWALTIGNDTYSTSDRGLSCYQSNDGTVYLRMRGDGAYEELNIQTNNGTTTNTAISIDENRAVELRYQNNIKLATTSTGVTVTGNVAVPSGNGIDFSATGNGGGTMSSELLDDYEEGSWTPIFSTDNDGASGQGYDVQRGRYTKIGRICELTFDIQLNTLGSFTGTYVTLAGLPFTNMEPNNIGGTLTVGYYAGFTLPASCSTITAYSDAGKTYLLTPRDSNGSTYILVSNVSSIMSNTSRIIGTILLNLTS